MSLGNKIRKNTLWLFAGGVSSRGIMFLSGIVLARLLVPEDFGLVVTIQIFTGIVSVVAGGGMGQALIRADDVTENHINVIFTTQVAIGLVIYVVFWLLSSAIADFFGSEIYEQLIKVSALTFVIRPFNNISSAKLSRNYNFKIVSLLAFFNVVISSLISIYMAFNGYGVWSLIVAGLITSLVLIPISLWLAKWWPKLSFKMEALKKYGAYGFKVSISNILYSIMVQIPNFFISKVHGPETLGLFNKASSLTEIPLQIIAGPVTQTVFRGMSEYKHDVNMSKYLYFRTLTLLCVYLFPFFTTMFWIAEPFVVIVYGENWKEAGQVMSIIALWGYSRTMIRPASIINDSHDRLKEEIYLDMEFILLLIVVLFFLTPQGINFVAAGLIVMGLYQMIRVTRLAYTCMDNATLKDFFKAVYPALCLNALLFLFLATLDNFVEFENISSFFTLAGTLILTVLIYIILFMTIPFEGLTGERNKIKNKLRNFL